MNTENGTHASYEDVAIELGVKVGYVYNLVSDGIFHPVRLYMIGRKSHRKFIPVVEVEAFKRGELGYAGRKPASTGDISGPHNSSHSPVYPALPPTGPLTTNGSRSARFVSLMTPIVDMIASRAYKLEVMDAMKETEDLLVAEGFARDIAHSIVMQSSRLSLDVDDNENVADITPEEFAARMAPNNPDQQKLIVEQYHRIASRIPAVEAGTK